MEQSSKMSKQMKFVLAGSMCLMLAIASHGLALSTIQGPVLANLNGSEWFSKITVICSIALCVMTPIGGSLCGMAGPGLIIIAAGITSIVSGLIMAFTGNLWVFLVCRVILAISQGAYASLPFVIINTELPRDQSPKWIGYLSMVSAIGATVGSYIGGYLSDHGMYGLAMSFPLIFVALAVVLIGMHSKSAKKPTFHLDWIGTILLIVALSGLLLGLNNGPVQGWYSMSVIASFFIGLIGLIAFIWWEDRYKAPLMPMRMFRIKEFSLVLFIGFLFAFYLNALNVYIPLAAQNIMGASTAVSGALQLPKTVVMLFLPALAGAWVVKNENNIWKALAISGITCAIAFGFMVFIGVKMPIWFLMCCIALTGFTEAFRSVGLLPAVQRVLSREDMAVGTSMIGFIMTLSSSVAAGLFGLCYNSLTARTAGIRGMTDGIDTICLLVCFLSIVGVMLVIMFLRPMLQKRIAQAREAREKEKASQKA